MGALSRGEDATESYDNGRKEWVAGIKIRAHATRQRLNSLH